MPPRKAQKTRDDQGASSSTPAYDVHCFLNKKASDAYTKILRWPLITERGFDFASFALAQNFGVRGWGIFLETPIEAVALIVKEFYANGRDSGYVKRDISWVRGKSRL